MSDHFDVIIVGAGASGLMCAANINKDLKVAVFEKTDRPGSKLLLSGLGQCNLTHSGDIADFMKAYGDNGRFLKKALYAFSNKSAVEYFEKRGVPLFEREDGKIFPLSKKASDILGVLQKEISYRGHPIITGTEISSISFNRDDNIFEVYSERGRSTSARLVLATGGSSYPRIGSTGDGYRFARSLGHTVVSPSPSLVPLKIENWPFSSVSGNSFKNAGLTYKKGSGKIIRLGELLITHTGISGPLVLDFSRYLSNKDVVAINFAAELNSESAFLRISELFREKPSSKTGTVLNKIGIPLNFSHIMLKISEIDPDTLCGEISKKHIRKLSENLCGYNAETLKESFDVAMSTAGGVQLTEISSLTMESKIIKGLYFCGEVLNIDGDTGGYNIQAAFATGYCAAAGINSLH
jgi:predicted Rossmann fold flavoprotein